MNLICCWKIVNDEVKQAWRAANKRAPRLLFLNISWKMVASCKIIPFPQFEKWKVKWFIFHYFPKVKGKLNYLKIKRIKFKSQKFSRTETLAGYWPKLEWSLSMTRELKVQGLTCWVWEYFFTFSSFCLSKQNSRNSDMFFYWPFF